MAADCREGARVFAIEWSHKGAFFLSFAVESTVFILQYLRPLYTKLFAWPEFRERALETFKHASQSMHPISATMVAAQIRATQS